MKVAIFPGHLGKDPGAVDGIDSNDKVYSVESAITASISSKLSLLLTMIGIDNKIQYGSFDDRISETKDCKLGVSIHADISTDENTRGYHVIHFPGSLAGEYLAGCIDKELSVLSKRFRHTHQEDFYILRKTLFPCVMVETGFLSNPFDEELLLQDSYQYEVAFSLASGVRKYLSQI